MALAFRPAQLADYPALEQLTLESFEPITWLRKIDERFGPLNGLDWRERWRARFCHAFNTQRVLLGEAGGPRGGLRQRHARRRRAPRLHRPARGGPRASRATATAARCCAACCEYFKSEGAEHVHLECLADNDVGNALYRSEGFEDLAHSVHWFIRIP